MKRAGSGVGAVLGIALALVLTACGDDGAATPADTAAGAPAETDVAVVDPPATDAPAIPEHHHSVGADDVVVQYTDLPGFPMLLRGFQSSPAALISGDGQYISSAPVAAIYPGPLLPLFQTRSISEAGIQTVLAAADEAGLMRELEYPPDPLVADADTAAVVVAADGARYEHDANALFLGGDGLRESPFTPEEQADREALAGFIVQFLEIEDLVGSDELGVVSPYEAEAYLMVAVPAEELGAVTDDPDVAVVEWPADTGVVLADVDGCIEAPASAVGDLFADATELTLFEEGGVVYRVAPIQRLPGRTC